MNGFSATAIVQLCKDIGVPIHIKWQNNKIESFVPEGAEYEAVAIYIWGDHMYTVGSESIRKAISKEKINAIKSYIIDMVSNLMQGCIGLRTFH